MQLSKSNQTLPLPVQELINSIETRFKNDSTHEVLLLLKSFCGKYIKEDNYYSILELLYKYDSEAYACFTWSTQDPNVYFVAFSEVNREKINEFIEYLSSRIDISIQWEKYRTLLENASQSNMENKKIRSSIVQWLESDLHLYSRSVAKQVEYIYHFVQFNACSENIDDFMMLIKQEKSWYWHTLYGNLIWTVSWENFTELDSGDLMEAESKIKQALISKENEHNERPDIINVILEDIDRNSSFDVEKYIEKWVYHELKIKPKKERIH